MEKENLVKKIMISVSSSMLKKLKFYKYKTGIPVSRILVDGAELYFKSKNFSFDGMVV